MKYAEIFYKVKNLEEKSIKTVPSFYGFLGGAPVSTDVAVAWVAGEVARPLNEQKILIAETNDNYALAA